MVLNGHTHLLSPTWDDSNHMLRLLFCVLSPYQINFVRQAIWAIGLASNEYIWQSDSPSIHKTQCIRRLRLPKNERSVLAKNVSYLLNIICSCSAGSMADIIELLCLLGFHCWLDWWGSTLPAMIIRNRQTLLPGGTCKQPFNFDFMISLLYCVLQDLT